MVLFLTLALAASQMFATALDAYFQLTIMLMILMMGVTAFAHFRPFVDDLLQRMQASNLVFSPACDSTKTRLEVVCMIYLHLHLDIYIFVAKCQISGENPATFSVILDLGSRATVYLFVCLFTYSFALSLAHPFILQTLS